MNQKHGLNCSETSLVPGWRQLGEVLSPRIFFFSFIFEYSEFQSNFWHGTDARCTLSGSFQRGGGLKGTLSGHFAKFNIVFSVLLKHVKGWEIWSQRKQIWKWLPGCFWMCVPGISIMLGILPLGLLQRRGTLIPDQREPLLRLLGLQARERLLSPLLCK